MNLHHQAAKDDTLAISGQVLDVVKEGEEVSTRL